MKPTNVPLVILFVLTVISLSCETKKDDQTKMQKTETVDNSEDLEKEMQTLMKRHLDAVTNRDLETLRATLSPNSDMQLILPQNEIIHGVEGFMEYHREWFEDSTWTFKTKILNSETGDKMGYAITEILYEEPDRDGGPYFNRMIVSYDLKRIDGKWYVIKDHASSIEKSTDPK